MTEYREWQSELAGVSRRWPGYVRVSLYAIATIAGWALVWAVAIIIRSVI